VFLSWAGHTASVGAAAKITALFALLLITHLAAVLVGDDGALCWDPFVHVSGCWMEYFWVCITSGFSGHVVLKVYG
jgi:hypothetical protein